MRTVLPALVLLAATLAGCAADGPGEPTPEEVERSQAAIYDAIEAAIGAPLLQSGPDPGRPDEMFLQRVATVTGEAGREPLAEGYVETAVKGGYAYLCRSGPEGGLAIFDVRDIENPAFTGFLALDAGFEPDIEVTDDGNYAFWETQRVGVPTVPDPTSLGGSLPRGIHVIDVSDKANPTWRGYTPVEPDGPHSITYANIGGNDYVFASIYSWQYVGTSVTPVTLAPPGAQRLSIYQLDPSEPGYLREVATYVDPDAAEPNPVMPEGGKMPHDVSIAVHPVTNRTYAYVAYWDLGVVILDVTDPANPTKVGAADDFGAAGSKEIHMARQSEGLIDGRVIVVAEPEIGQQETTGYMSMIDVTDPTAPVFVSNWKIPGDSDSAGGGRGPHYFDLREGRVTLASYSAGFWVFDIHDRANLEQPRTVGYSFSQGSAFDAWWADETHVVGSDGSGLVVFRYTGPTPGLNEQVTEFDI